MWALKIEPRSSRRVADAFSHQAISPAPNFGFLSIKKIEFLSCCCIQGQAQTPSIWYPDGLWSALGQSMGKDELDKENQGRELESLLLSRADEIDAVSLKLQVTLWKPPWGDPQVTRGVPT